MSSNKRPMTKTERRIFIVLSFLLFFFGLFMSVFYSYVILFGERAEMTVVENNVRYVRGRRGGSYRLFLTYSYEIDGLQYEFKEERSGNKERKFPVGTVSEVHYLKNHPEKGYTWHNSAGYFFVLVTFSLIVIPVTHDMIVLAKRKRKEKYGEIPIELYDQYER